MLGSQARCLAAQHQQPSRSSDAWAHLPLWHVGSMQVMSVGGLVLDLVTLALIKVPIGHKVWVIELDGGVIEVAAAGACAMERHCHALYPHRYQSTALEGHSLLDLALITPGLARSYLFSFFD